MAFLVKALFRWNEYSKNADISVLSNFLAIFFESFSLYREILPSTIYMPNLRSIGPFKQKVQRGGGRTCPPPAIPICKQPGLFRVKKKTEEKEVTNMMEEDKEVAMLSEKKMQLRK